MNLDLDKIGESFFFESRVVNVVKTNETKSLVYSTHETLLLCLRTSTCRNNLYHSSLISSFLIRSFQEGLVSILLPHFPYIHYQNFFHCHKIIMYTRCIEPLFNLASYNLIITGFLYPFLCCQYCSYLIVNILFKSTFVFNVLRSQKKLS